MDISKIKPGKNIPEEINVFIEIPQGSQIKYELNKDSGIIEVDRFLYTSTYYPFNYGFIPNTLTDDGDPVDVLVISSLSVYPGTIIPSKPIGILEMEDEAGIDWKVIAVPKEKIDPEYGKINDISELSDYLKSKIKHFFEVYKQLEPNKWVKTKDFLNKEKAKEQIQKSIKTN
ncbi:MAG: inorganic diphosphatase [Patescibacteria group bacterium]|nr:inorganic diphosphatase [Patescibacteria group bacterium]MCX7589370.1 inorganic diphosphatase [Patescibacteria group bacterium]MDW8279887.1 inorganic diphosphatase [bacterium]